VAGFGAQGEEDVIDRRGQAIGHQRLRGLSFDAR